MENYILRLRIKSYDYILLNRTVNKIISIVKSSRKGKCVFIFLPTKNRIYTVLRSPHVHKKSREQFKLSLHSRLLDIKNINLETLNRIMNFKLISGISIIIINKFSY